MKRKGKLLACCYLNEDNYAKIYLNDEIYSLYFKKLGKENVFSDKNRENIRKLYNEKANTLKKGNYKVNNVCWGKYKKVL